MRWWPASLLGRLTLVMVAGVLITQLAGNAIWARQLRAKALDDTDKAAQYLGHGAANTIRFFRSVPPAYRPLLIQQFREMGGTRFFAHLGTVPVAVPAIAGEELATRAVDTLQATLKADLPFLSHTQAAFAWPDQLQVSEGARVADLPDNWVRDILLVKPDAAPVLVLQAELEPGNWLYLAALMPNPYFLQSGQALPWQQLLLQTLPLAVVLLLSTVLVLRWITRPLAQLSEAAAAGFERDSKDDRLLKLPETGSREFVNTARAFSAMRQRIQQYLEDRERLFISISHDLRTPITRLKLRSELLDDDQLRDEFEEDLDELDMMVKGALQCVKDTEIHENTADLKLDTMLSRLVRGARLGGHEVAFTDCGLTVRAKPLALKRALGNLLDNALFYGQRAEVSVAAEDGWVAIRIRDHGPGVAPEALGTVFEPRVRLSHGRSSNEGGLGLGLGIARSIVQAQGGTLTLDNHPQGGLVASVRLPAPTAAAD